MKRWIAFSLVLCMTLSLSACGGYQLDENGLPVLPGWRRSGLNKALQEYEMIDVQSVLFFETPMSMMEDTLQIVGGKGYLDVTNISNKATPENVYIYYKNSAVDLLYGGITYRARIEQPIKPGETVRVMTKHYHSESCRLIMVTCGE